MFIPLLYLIYFSARGLKNEECEDSIMVDNFLDIHNLIFQ